AVNDSRDLYRFLPPLYSLLLCFFTPPATTAIYTLSLHDALPIFPARGGRAYLRPARRQGLRPPRRPRRLAHRGAHRLQRRPPGRSEEHTSELQSRENLVCRLLLEKKKL